MIHALTERNTQSGSGGGARIRARAMAALGAMMRALVVAAALAAMPGASPAQERSEETPAYVMGAGAPAGSSEGAIWSGVPAAVPSDSHAWFVVPNGRGDAIVMHVPPRAFAWAFDGRLHGSEDGIVRQAARLQKAPSAIAAWGDRLYLMDDRPEGYPSSPRFVSSIRAVRSGVGDLWATQPLSGRDVHPSLMGTGQLVSFVGTSLGPAALIWDESAPGVGRPLRALLLADRRWVELSIPAEAGEAARRANVYHGDPKRSVRLISTLRGIEIVVLDARQIRSWVVDLDKDVATSVRQSLDEEAGAGESSVGPIGVRWRAGVFDGATVPTDDGGPDFVGVVGERAIWAGRVTSNLMVVRSREGLGWRELCRLDGVGSPCGTAPLDGVGRLAIVWAQPPTTGGNEVVRVAREMRQEIREVSVFSGREMYAGAWKSASPVSLADVKVVLLVLLGAMSLVVVFVLRSESTNDLVLLPEGTALAEPSRRLLGSFVDFTVALALAAEVMGGSVREFLSIEAFLSGQGVWMLLVALGIGAGIGVVSEWFFGKSLGKLLTGCRVVHSRAGAPGGEAHVGLFACILRNVLKWGLPPLAVTMFLDSTGRHAADRLSRMVVVVDVIEDDEGA